MKAFITKYALTKGIIEVEGEKRGENFAYGGYNLALSGDWFANKEGAIRKAEILRSRKILSLKRQLIKLEKMKFT